MTPHASNPAWLDKAPVRMELLAPAGDPSALAAAVEAGASAVYLGLKDLNARRAARNFSQGEFAQAVQMAHARQVRVYLTLNIDLATRELGEAARMLELARRCNADAVLVRDPALLALRRLYPELEFHFSTQTGMTNSAEIRAAAGLGASHVVLAREMTLQEIAEACRVPDIRAEVFAQGAMCFCISGRCLLSSWIGGRSGNRGACASPCRLPWTVNDAPMGTPLSMRDLRTIHRLRELAQAGVGAIKIEGRLKSASWVSAAVSLYRRALAGEDPAPLAEQALDLGTYTGREMACGYLDGQRDQLTGLAAGRLPSAPTGPEAVETTSPDQRATHGPPDYDLDVHVQERGIFCTCSLGGRTVRWRLPRTVVRRRERAVSVDRLLEHLRSRTILDHRLGAGTTNQGDFLLVPRVANAFPERVAAALRQLRPRQADSRISIELPPAVRSAISPVGRCQANDLVLGQMPDRARVDASDLAGFLKRVRAHGSAGALPESVIIENPAAADLSRIRGICRDVSVVAALPAVFFEPDISQVQQIIEAAVACEIPVEVNSWGGWYLASQAGATMEGGPGLGVLNPLAARFLGDLGMRCVSISVEADRQQLEQLTARCPVPCSITVFGRPALMVTRLQLPHDRFADAVLADRRGVRLRARLERGLWTLRPVQPFDLRETRNDQIHACHLVVDLTGSPDPAEEWLRRPAPGSRPFRFNYDRRLY